MSRVGTHYKYELNCGPCVAIECVAFNSFECVRNTGFYRYKLARFPGELRDKSVTDVVCLASGIHLVEIFEEIDSEAQ